MPDAVSGGGEGDLAAHGAAVQQFLAAARAVPDDAWERPLAAGAWSPAQVAEHLRLSYAVVHAELHGGPGLRIRTPWLVRVLLRWRVMPRILSTGRLPAGARASSEIRPGAGPYPRGAVLEALAQAATATAAAIATRRDERGAGITHHVFGRVALPEALRFLTVHTAHHARQLAGRGGAGA